MLLPAILAVALLFGLLLIGRVGAARRAKILVRWPALLFAGAAIAALSRGLLWPGLLMALAAAAAWMLWPKLSAARTQAPAESVAERDARAILGVGPQAGESEIRAAYRAKMAQAHPDRGGAHTDAARLTAARDLLLRKRR